MSLLDPELTGQHVRLEPLGGSTLAGLAAAVGRRRRPVPDDQGAGGGRGDEAITSRLLRRPGPPGTAAPFAVVRLADETVVGSTRLFDLEWWPWPKGHPRHGHDGPDTCEIGHTWLRGRRSGRPRTPR